MNWWTDSIIQTARKKCDSLKFCLGHIQLVYSCVFFNICQSIFREIIGVFGSFSSLPFKIYNAMFVLTLTPFMKIWNSENMSRHCLTTVQPWIWLVHKWYNAQPEAWKWLNKDCEVIEMTLIALLLNRFIDKSIRLILY